MKTHVFASGLLPSSRILRVLALAEGGSRPLAKTWVFISGLLPSSRILRVLALAEGGSVCRPYPRVDRSSGSGRVGAVVALAADGSSDKNRKRPCFSRRRGAQVVLALIAQHD